MALNWRFLGLLPVILLTVGVGNLLLLHSLSSALGPDLIASDVASPSTKYRRQHSTITRHALRHGETLATSIGSKQEDSTETRKQGRLDATSTAVIYPATNGDRTTSALVFVLRERALHPDFCRQDLARCIAHPTRGKTDLVWLKKEGNAGEIPENSLAGAAAVNSLGVGWKVWSRRSLCMALYLNRKAFKDQSKVSSLTSWYPECYTLPLKEAQTARLRGDTTQAPDGGMWVVHGSRSQSLILPSGEAAAKVTGVGVMQRYISPPLTLQGYKFSLLLYVAVTSLSPLRLWLYHDGHVLIASHPYSERVSDKVRQEAHVTHLDAHPEKVQHIRGKSGLLNHLAASEIAVDHVWTTIEDAVGIAVLSAATYFPSAAAPKAGEGSKTRQEGEPMQRFKLLAAHVVLDASLTPWVVKIDPSPLLLLDAPSKPSASEQQQNDDEHESRGNIQDEILHGDADHLSAPEPPDRMGEAESASLEATPKHHRESLLDHEDEYTKWMFQDDVHDISADLSRLKSQLSQLSHMRERRQQRLAHNVIHAHTHTYTYMHTCTHARTHVHTHTRTHTHIHSHIHTYTRTHTHRHRHTHTHTHTYTHTHTHIHIHTQTHTHTHARAHTHTPTHTHTHTHTLSLSLPHTQRVPRHPRSC